MRGKDRDPRSILDEAVAEIRNQPVDAELEDQAAARVWSKLSHEAGQSPERAATADSGATRLLRTCSDYQALMPAYLSGELSGPRLLLLEDHTRECVPCRRSLKEARAGRGIDGELVANATAEAGEGRRRRGTWLAIAATLVLAIALAMVIQTSGVLESPVPELAQIRAVDGILLHFDAAAQRRAAPGEWIGEGERVRTGKDSGAVLELADGSRIEMAQRSELAVLERQDRITIRVARGSIIVEAAKQGDGVLRVATDECLVSVTGTIFAVSHGTKGSRVSVIEGGVRVEKGRQERMLYAGDQFVTHAGLGRRPVVEEIAWSRDGDRYIGLLRELAELRQEMSQLVAAKRFEMSTRLAELVPGDTVVYAALPNLTVTLSEIHQFLQARLAQSTVLAEWWDTHVRAPGVEPELEAVIERLRAFGEHLEDQVVVAVVQQAAGQVYGGVALAEIRDVAGFQMALESEVERLAEESGAAPRIVDDPFSESVAGEHGALFWIHGDIFVAATSLPVLQISAATVQQGGPSTFVDSELYARIAEAYQGGAELIVAADAARMMTVVGQSRDEDRQQILEASGIANLSLVVLERKRVGEQSQTAAMISFRGPREGLAGWLAQPGPMASLDFFSADALLVAAFLSKEPAAMLEELFGLMTAAEPEFASQLAEFESRFGIDVRHDLAAPLGGEVAFGLDGPAFPEPSWKVVLEVYDSVGLQQALEWLVERLNEAAVEEGRGGVVLEQQQSGDRIYYRINLLGESGAVFYTYVDGYLVAAPSPMLLERSISYRETGFGLVDAAEFRQLLPEDGYIDFSAVVFDRVGSLFGPMLAQITSAQGDMTAAQKQALEELGSDSSPSLYCAYGEEDRIRVVSHGGGLLDLPFGRLLGISHLMVLPPEVQGGSESTAQYR